MKKILIILVALFWCNVGFAGCIKGDCTNGYGTETYSDGSKYVGEWSRTQYLEGTYTYADGSTYVGEWKDGKGHGQGTSTWASGNKYVGEWKDGEQHGQGTLTFASGDKYVGEFKDGEEHGQGTSTWASGNKYVGEFKYGKGHGQGTLTFADGTVDNGIWKDSELVERNNIKTQIVKKEPKKKTSDDLVKQLKDLNELYESGVLTEEEFVKIKQKLLN